jgi:hypothetical protein
MPFGEGTSLEAGPPLIFESVAKAETRPFAGNRRQASLGSIWHTESLKKASQERVRKTRAAVCAWF